MPIALEQNLKQRALDIAHHAGRVGWLEHPAPRWRCGTLVSARDRADLLRVSRAILANTCLGTHTATPPVPKPATLASKPWMPPVGMRYRSQHKLTP